MNEGLLNALCLVLNPDNLGKQEITDLVKLRKYAQSYIINTPSFLPDLKVIGTGS